MAVFSSGSQEMGRAPPQSAGVVVVVAGWVAQLMQLDISH